jgi:hypothetical protein
MRSELAQRLVGKHRGNLVKSTGDGILARAARSVARGHLAPGSNEVLVSRVVTDLVAGAGLKFSERGSQELDCRVDGSCSQQAPSFAICCGALVCLRHLADVSVTLHVRFAPKAALP